MGLMMISSTWLIRARGYIGGKACVNLSNRKGYPAALPLPSAPPSLIDLKQAVNCRNRRKRRAAVGATGTGVSKNTFHLPPPSCNVAERVKIYRRLAYQP